jgi:hypothetical protein
MKPFGTQRECRFISLSGIFFIPSVEWVVPAQVAAE